MFDNFFKEKFQKTLSTPQGIFEYTHIGGPLRYTPTFSPSLISLSNRRQQRRRPRRCGCVASHRAASSSVAGVAKAAGPCTASFVIAGERKRDFISGRERGGGRIEGVVYCGAHRCVYILENTIFFLLHAGILHKSWRKTDDRVVYLGFF